MGSAALTATAFNPPAFAADRRNGARERTIYTHYRDMGPFPVKVANPLSFRIQEQSKDLLVRVTYPDPSAPSRGETFPAILFSHGGGASKDLYVRLADHWAPHGYVVILPTHFDSASLNYKIGSQDPFKYVSGRIGDLKFLLDHLGEVAEQTPALTGRLDAARIAVGGHSVGVLAALALAGLRLKDARGRAVDFTDKRVRAIVSINGIGPLPMAGDDWSAVKLPVFAAGGTNDPGTATGGGLASWRWRLSPYLLTTGPDRYAVSIAGGDHDFGGLIAHDGETSKGDADGLVAVSALSTAFLDKELSNNSDARHLLQEGDIAALTQQHAFLESQIG